MRLYVYLRHPSLYDVRPFEFYDHYLNCKSIVLCLLPPEEERERASELCARNSLQANVADAATFFFLESFQRSFITVIIISFNRLVVASVLCHQFCSVQNELSRSQHQSIESTNLFPFEDFVDTQRTTNRELNWIHHPAVACNEREPRKKCIM